jgi:hypothetical protein
MNIVPSFGRSWLQNTVKNRLRQYSVYAEAEATRAVAIGRRLACVVKLERGQHELAEQAAPDAAMGEKA